VLQEQEEEEEEEEEEWVVLSHLLFIATMITD
jgi:hypothetical protein